jgi:hypothetical protein
MRFCRGDDYFVHLLRMGNLATITVWGCSSVFAQKVFNILLFKTILGGCKNIIYTVYPQTTCLLDGLAHGDL